MEEYIRSPRQKDETRFNPNYFAIIRSTRHPNVVARLPEEVPLTVSSDWESPLGSTFSGLKAKATDFVLRETAGLTLKNQLFSSQIWSGSSPIEMTVPLEFYADREPFLEVISPIIALAKMALPRYSNNKYVKGAKEFLTIEGKQIPLKPLTAPGPTIFDLDGRDRANAEGDLIDIQLGDFLLFSKVIITNVNINFNTRDLVGGAEDKRKQGKPLRASCELTFRTLQSLTGEDFEAMFI